MSATRLQELLSTLMPIIQSEICKQTAALEAKLTAESSRQSADSAKQTAACYRTSPGWFGIVAARFFSASLKVLS